MTKAERGELAFKIAGIVWFVRSLPLVPTLYYLIRQVARTGFDEGEWLGAALTIAYEVAAMVIPALCLITFARRLSRWLLRPDESEFASIFEEALHTGIVLIGFSFALAYAFAVLLVFRDPVVLAPCIVGTVLPLCMLASAPRLTRFLNGHGQRVVEADNASAAIVWVGLALMGLYLCLRSVIGGASAVAVLLWLPIEVAPLYEETVKMFRVRTVYTSAACLVLSIALVLSAPRIAPWLCRGRKEVDEGRPATAGPGARTYVELTLFAGLIYVFVNCVTGPTGPCLSAWRPRDAIALVVVAAVAMALSMGVFYVGRVCLAQVARWLVPGNSANGEGNGVRALLILEVAITIIALHYLASRLLALSWIAADMAPPAGAVLCLGIFLLRSDIAWLMLGRRRPTEAVSAERRAAALYPWLILLGVWLVVVYLPGAPAGLALRDIYYPPVHLPHLGFVAGLGLMFAPGWISRRLSYGRIIPRIWRAPRPVG